MPGSVSTPPAPESGGKPLFAPPWSPVGIVSSVFVTQSCGTVSSPCDPVVGQATFVGLEDARPAALDGMSPPYFETVALFTKWPVACGRTSSRSVYAFAEPGWIERCGWHVTTELASSPAAVAVQSSGGSVGPAPVPT